MSPKELVRLAAACRKAGIKTYKDKDIEFTLTDEVPLTKHRKAANRAEAKSDTQGEIETDELTQDALLMWSVPDAIEGAN